MSFYSIVVTAYQEIDAQLLKSLMLQAHIGVVIDYLRLNNYTSELVPASP